MGFVYKKGSLQKRVKEVFFFVVVIRDQSLCDFSLDVKCCILWQTPVWKLTEDQFLCTTQKDGNIE